MNQRFELGEPPHSEWLDVARGAEWLWSQPLGFVLALTGILVLLIGNRLTESES